MSFIQVQEIKSGKTGPYFIRLEAQNFTEGTDYLVVCDHELSRTAQPEDATPESGCYFSRTLKNLQEALSLYNAVQMAPEHYCRYEA